jgi:crossover junction endodeoxyribonuclease RusA|tara:strand:- start:898 stop:1260 length:363 start_codon:yes stop_codon:yes gene_type:complete
MPKGAKFPVITDANKNLKQWRDLTSFVAQDYAPKELVESAVELHIDFFFARPKSLPKKVTRHIKKPDLSKLIRSIEDSLTNIVWNDDSQVVKIIATKNYGTPRAEIQVYKIENRPQSILS